jgi:hypothetical protein
MLLNLKNIIILNYDKFFYNYDYIFQILENKLNLIISNEEKIQIYEKVNIDSVKNIITKFKNFQEYDEDSHYNGNDISLYNSSMNYLEEIFYNESKNIFEFIEKVNTMNSNYYKKTVIQVLQTNGNHLDNVKHSYKGIGDLMRGCLTLYKLSKIMNFNLIIDFDSHPICKYIKKSKSIYLNLILL